MTKKSKEKNKDILIIVLASILACMIVGIFLMNNRKNTKPKEILGDSFSMTVYSNDISYAKRYNIMDCCDEFYKIDPIIKGLQNLSGYTFMDFDLFDNKGNNLGRKGKISVLLTIPENIIKCEGDTYKIYQVDNECKAQEVESSVQENKIKFELDDSEDYLFAITKFGTNVTKPQLEEIECDGSCKSCN